MTRPVTDLDLNRRLELALEASGIGIWEHNATTDEISWDTRLRAIYGISASDPPTWIEMVHPDDRVQAEGDFTSALERKSGYFSRFRIVRPDGEIRHILSRAHCHENERGDTLLIGAEWDVTADVLREEQLRSRTLELGALRREAERAASLDYLTDLPNRRGLQAFTSTAPQGQVASRAVLHIDLDDFKSINDELGHDAGDDYLRQFAQGLRSMLPEGAFAARLGGDEFVVLLPSASTETASLIASSLISLAGSLTQRRGLGTAAASIGLSIGAGEWNDHITASDIALYDAKRSGRGRLVVATAPGVAVLHAGSQ